MTRTFLLLTSALTALSLSATGAFAQTTPAGANDDNNGAIEVGGVTVTAERRETNVQDVPVAVTAITSAVRDQLGIVTIADVTAFTPGFSYNPQSDRSSIRGISRFFNNQAAQGSVAIYSDGAYTSSTFELGKASIFVDRVEVLRGPQGTLYGRNAIGGAINIISRRPTDHWYAEARGSVGNYGATEFGAAVSGPITDWLRFRLAASKSDQTEGYFRNAYPNNGGYDSEGNRRNEYYIEAQLAFNVGDAFDGWLKVGYREWNNRNGGPGNRAGPLLTPYYNNTNPAAAATTGASRNGNSPLIPSLEFGTTEINPACPTATIVNTVYQCQGGDPRSFATNTPGHITLDNAPVASLQLAYHGSGFDVRYIAGYARYKYGLDFDLDGTANNGSYILAGTSVPCTGVAAPVPSCTGAGVNSPGVRIFNTGTGHYEEDKEWNSHELTISSTGDSAVSWIAGAYWYHDNNSYTPLTNVSLPQQDELAQPLAQYDLCAFAGNAIRSPVLGAGPFIAQPLCDGTNNGAVVNRVNAAPNPRRIYAYNHFDGGTESYAAFGQVSWRLNERITLTGGLRYSHDETDVIESARYTCFAAALCSGSATALSTAPGTAGGSFSYDPTFLIISQTSTDPSVVPGSVTQGADGNWHRELRNSWSAVTGVAKIEWRPDNDTLAYASYTRGFKAGGFNAGSIAAVPTAGAEHVNAYEIGVKRNWGRTFQVNASLFYYDYLNPQAPLAVIPASGVRRTDFINIPQTRNLGLELETIWSPVPEFQLLFNYALLDAHITRSGCYVDPNDPLATLPQASPGGCAAIPGSQPQNLTGATMPASPLNRLTINANYTFHLDPGNLILSATWQYRSSTFYDIFNREYSRAPAWTQTDLRATFTDRDNRYSIIAYGRNIFDQLGYEGMASDGLGGVAGQGQGRAPVLTPPRTYGIELQYRFF